MVWKIMEFNIEQTITLTCGTVGRIMLKL
jgi:hypothetical protein